MENIWFTADHHFGHTNVIRYDGRPYDNIDAMDADLIQRWNSVVAPTDVVYHVGDLFWYRDIAQARAVRSRLNGRIRLVRGNHDSTADRMPDAFEWIRGYYEAKIPDPDAPDGRQLVVLCHYAFRVWNQSHHGSYHLYGHSHGSLRADPHARSFDIGCMLHNYAPVSYEHVKAIMSAKQWRPVDHHR